METSQLKVIERLEKQLIIFVLAHTNTLEEAAKYVGLNVCTLRERREKYGIPTPPPRHYDGPALTHDEMFAAFCASLAPPAPAFDLAALANRIKVTITPPDGPAITVPLASVLPL
jgi:hypothetical protein